MIIFILAQYAILFIVSTLIGARINQFFKLNLHSHLNLVIGFIAILSLTYLITIIWVILRLRPFYFYIVLSIVLGLCILSSLLNLKKYLISNYKFYALGFIIVIILMGLTLRYSYGIRSFDGAVYLSSVLDNINAPFLNAFNPYDGKLVTQINVENDYQSFYYLNSYFLWIFTQVQLFLKQEFLPSLSSVYLVSMTAFYFTFLYHLVLGTIQTLKLKSKTSILFILIYLFVYFTSAYFNSSLSFLGQSYRTLIIGFMTLIVYINLNHQLDDKYTVCLLSLSSIAAISTSSSAYFIVFILLFAWLFSRVKDTDNLMYIQYCLIAAYPIVLFVLLYTFSNTNFIIGLLGLLFIVFYGLYHNPKYLVNLKSIVQYVIPFTITFVSIGLIIFRGSSITRIFTQASAYDMVFDYFNFYSPVQIIINLLLWTSIIILMFKGNKNFRNYYLTLFIVFINPLNFVFLYELLAGQVVHRVFDVLFNPVALIILFSFALSLFNKWLKGIFLCMLIIISIYAQTQMYHFVFERPNDSSYIERIPHNEIDMLNVLNTKIILEKLERSKVVSQIHFVRAYVKNITLPLSYRTYRSLRVYEEVIEAPSELWNIFVYRDFETMRIFDTTPDYANTCKYLIEEKVDFVLVARNQFYREKGDYVPLYFRVRDCASIVYENDDYLLYQFYW